jgi:hypothetical protein
MPQRGQEVAAHLGKTRLDLLEESPHCKARRSLLLRPGVPREGWEALLANQGREVGLGAIEQRADHCESPAPGRKLWGQRLKLASEEEVQEKGLDRVLAVVPQSDLVAAQPLGRAIDGPALEDGAVVFPGDSRRLQRGLFDFAGEPPLFERPTQRLHVALWRAEVEDPGSELETNRGSAAQVLEHRQERDRVRATGDGDKDLVALFEKTEVLASMSEVSPETVAQVGHESPVALVWGPVHTRRSSAEETGIVLSRATTRTRGSGRPLAALEEGTRRVPSTSSGLCRICSDRDDVDLCRCLVPGVSAGTPGARPRRSGSAAAAGPGAVAGKHVRQSHRLEVAIQDLARLDPEPS